MYDFLKDFDGSSKTPRPVQVEALNWISENWDTTKVFVLNAPVGSGKSAIARAIQKKVGGYIITPSNLLVDQYLKEFPMVNHLIGKSHYQCKMGMSCKDWTDVLQQPACTNCVYKANRDKAIANEPTFFNPISLYYIADLSAPPKIIIVDEAHQLEGMLLELCSYTLKKSEHPFDSRCLNELYLIQFLEARLAALTKLIQQKKAVEDFRAINALSSEFEKLKFTMVGLKENAQNYAIWISQKTIYGRPETILNVKPLFIPKQIIKRVLYGHKILLMSGTVSPFDIEQLLGEDVQYKYLELDSPIPKENRPVFFDPINVPMNKDTNPVVIVDKIEQIIKKNPGLNTIVHVTYSMSLKIIPYFNIPVIYNKGPADKEDALTRFKAEGGILIAAGMSEGIDLPGDMCRLNIIPKLFYPDISDKVVSKKMAMAAGNKWYNLESFKKLMQQVGRSTRGVNDYSKTYILDSGFAWRFKQFKDYLPKHFTESITWNSN